MIAALFFFVAVPALVAALVLFAVVLALGESRRRSSRPHRREPVSGSPYPRSSERLR